MNGEVAIEGTVGNGAKRVRDEHQAGGVSVLGRPSRTVRPVRPLVAGAIVAVRPERRPRSPRRRQARRRRPVHGRVPDARPRTGRRSWSAPVCTVGRCAGSGGAPAARPRRSLRGRVEHGGEGLGELPERLVAPAGRSHGERLGDRRPQVVSAVLHENERCGRATRAPSAERVAESRQRHHPLRPCDPRIAPLLPAA